MAAWLVRKTNTCQIKECRSAYRRQTYLCHPPLGVYQTTFLDHPRTPQPPPPSLRLFSVGKFGQGASECVPSAIVTAFTAPRQGGVQMQCRGRVHFATEARRESGRSRIVLGCIGDIEILDVSGAESGTIRIGSANSFFPVCATRRKACPTRQDEQQDNQGSDRNECIELEAAICRSGHALARRGGHKNEYQLLSYLPGH